jgi:hypothetical protein
MAAKVAQQVPGPPFPLDASAFGSSSDEAQAVEQARNAQISEIVERLQWRYTREQISIADLDRRVSGFYRRFDAARVRNFAAIVVEGLVQRSIPSAALSPREL